MTESLAFMESFATAHSSAWEGTELNFVGTITARGQRLCNAAVISFLALSAVFATSIHPARAGETLEERKMPMRFSWTACQPNCGGWVSAVGIITADSPADFDVFARRHDLAGATVVLDSSGGSVNDAIALGRRFRELGMRTTVGLKVEDHTAQGDRASVAPDAYCESMCVFLLLSGKTRYVPEAAHVRVHQIWMGDRADDARAANYSAQDLMIVERDIGRLARYTFDMGGGGELLSMALSVPPWEDLRELSQAELRRINLVTTGSVADVLPPGIVTGVATPVAELKPKAVQDRFVSDTASDPAPSHLMKSTKTAEATVPTGGLISASPQK